MPAIRKRARGAHEFQLFQQQFLQTVFPPHRRRGKLPQQAVQGKPRAVPAARDAAAAEDAFHLLRRQPRRAGADDADRPWRAVPLPEHRKRGSRLRRNDGRRLCCRRIRLHGARSDRCGRLRPFGLRRDEGVARSERSGTEEDADGGFLASQRRGRAQRRRGHASRPGRCRQGGRARGAERAHPAGPPAHPPRRRRATLATQQLTLHGWVYDIESGDVRAVDELTGELRALRNLPDALDTLDSATE